MSKLTITYDGHVLFDRDVDEVESFVKRTELSVTAKFADITPRIQGSILDEVLKTADEVRWVAPTVGVFVAPKLGVGFKDGQ